MAGAAAAPASTGLGENTKSKSDDKNIHFYPLVDIFHPNPALPAATITGPGQAHPRMAARLRTEYSR